MFTQNTYTHKIIYWKKWRARGRVGRVETQYTISKKNSTHQRYFSKEAWKYLSHAGEEETSSNIFQDEIYSRAAVEYFYCRSFRCPAQLLQCIWSFISPKTWKNEVFFHERLKNKVLYLEKKIGKSWKNKQSQYISSGRMFFEKKNRSVHFYPEGTRGQFSCVVICRANMSLSLLPMKSRRKSIAWDDIFLFFNLLPSFFRCIKTTTALIILQNIEISFLVLGKRVQLSGGSSCLTFPLSV